MGGDEKFSETTPQHGVVTHESKQTYMILIKIESLLAEILYILNCTQ
jgi:hypothetical protein